MTKIEVLEKGQGRMAGNMYHVQALIEGLDGRPQDFVYRGEVDEGDDNSHCVCGHPIHYLFPVYDIKNEANMKILGSTCIENYGLYRPEDAKWMQQKYEELLEKIAAAKKAQKEAIAKIEIEKLTVEHDALLDKINDVYQNNYRKVGKYVPYILWSAVCNKKGCARYDAIDVCSRYEKSGHMLRALKRNIENMKLVNQELSTKIA